MQSLELSQTFFDALQFPEYARANFFIIHQKESGWSKGVYLTALSEVYHHCILVLQIHLNAKKNKEGTSKLEDIKLSLKKLVGIDSEKLIDKAALDEIHYAVQVAWKFDQEKLIFSPYHILSFVETALIFIKEEFFIQTKRKDSSLFRQKTNSHYTYLIASDAPFFDFPKFKNAIRELLNTTRNVKKLEKLLTAFHKESTEIVKLWNEELFFIEQNSSKEQSPSLSEIVRVEFHWETLSHTWWVDDKLFEEYPHKLFMNQDFAVYAVKIANLINGSVIHGRETEIKIIQKDFLDDFIRGIKHLLFQSNNEVSIKNILQNINNEAPFRDFFSNWFTAQNYITSSEPLRGNNYIDLKVEHPSISNKIIEFKGWWNSKKTSLILQLFNYLTQFEGEGFIVLINHSGKSIETAYQKIITNQKNGFVLNSWKKFRYKRTTFYFYQSEHTFGLKKKQVFHFILDIDKPVNLKKLH